MTIKKGMDQFWTAGGLILDAISLFRPIFLGVKKSCITRFATNAQIYDKQTQFFSFEWYMSQLASTSRFLLTSKKASGLVLDASPLHLHHSLSTRFPTRIPLFSVSLSDFFPFPRDPVFPFSVSIWLNPGESIVHIPYAVLY